jgi:CHAT domain-containing protein
VREKIRGLDETLTSGTAVLYPIAFEDRIELLLSLPSGLQRITVPVGRDDLVQEVRTFRGYLEKRTTRQYMRQARQLYNWLIRPLHKQLEANDIRVLVLVPDATLRTVPLAALHDGGQFLVENYAVATTPSMRLSDPRPIDRGNVTLLLNGLSVRVEDFPALLYVDDELAAISEIYGGKQLQNESFRKARLEQELAGNEYSIVHLATHGKFAGKVRDSFVLTYDGRMSMDELEQFVGISWFREDNPVELLTLSACETAVGDDSAALGLASVAIKAGARSALASLWSINDEASSKLVADFYRELQDPGITKAQALQRAQLGLLADLRYQHPVYWSPFLLIGNWL